MLVDETRESISAKLELWRLILESKGFRLSRSKTEYIRCRFSESYRNDEKTIKLDGQNVPKSERFRYLGSIIQNDGNVDGNVNYRIQTTWMKWRKASGVLCERTMSLHLKGKFYRIVVKSALLYGIEYWDIKK